MTADEFDLTISDAYRTPGRRRNNFAATVAPTVTDDEDDGYEVGSVWVDTVAEVAWTCIDPTGGAAVWSAGGGSVTADDLYDLGVVGAVLMSEDITDPPEPVWTESGDDWITAELG